MICLISRPLLIALRHDWHQSKGLLKGFKLALRPWESSKNWWRYDQMKFVTTPIEEASTFCKGKSIGKKIKEDRGERGGMLMGIKRFDHETKVKARSER